MSKETLKGKVAVVTGAARGIGAAIAERLAREGAAVVVNYSRSGKDAEAVAERIRSAGGHAITYRADLADPADAARLVDAAFREFGRLDILVNNAGMATFAPLEAIDAEHVASQVALNVTGPIFATKAAAARFPEEGGRVINVGSVASTAAMPATSVYSASKAALDALTRVWAAELGPRGITVNAVAPGPIDTDMLRGAMPVEQQEYAISRTPLGRLGAPADVADVVAFLASPDSRWVTGEVIRVAGGMHP